MGIMRKPGVLIAIGLAFGAGFICGLLWAAYKGAPPGLGPPTASIPAFTEADRAHLAELEERTRQHPDSRPDLVALGNFAMDTGRFDTAKEAYERALKLKGDDPDVLTDLGIVYRRTGQPKKAVELFRRARQVNPSHVNSAFNLGVVLLHDLKDRQGALEAWEEYLKLEPSGERADMIRRVLEQLRRNPQK
jgi:cytochrome c-type biogenesis protein CcmH/NrfG